MKTVMCYTAGQTTKGAVAIRKPAGAGNGYRVCWVGAFKEIRKPRAATMWRHGAGKKVESVQRFSLGGGLHLAQGLDDALIDVL